MAIALNLIALIMVIGLCWAAMMWLSGRFHQHGRPQIEMVEIDGLADVTLPKIAPAECELCEGLGASHRRGKLSPCPQCLGTGVLS